MSKKTQKSDGTVMAKIAERTVYFSGRRKIKLPPGETIPGSASAARRLLREIYQRRAKKTDIQAAIKPDTAAKFGAGGGGSAPVQEPACG